MVIFAFETKPSAWVIATVAVYVIITVLLTILVGILNYFQIRDFRDRFSKFTYIALKATVVIFFLEALVHFVICALHLAFNVSGLDDRRDDLHTAVSLLHHVVHLAFLHKVVSFLWVKLFCDNKDILKGPDNDMR